MTVLRIVPNVAAADVEATAAFYADVLCLQVAMDLGWIVTLAAAPAATSPVPQQTPQVSVARDGGSGAPVPELSVEVDDLDAAYVRALARGAAVEYGPAREPWGVRRFFVRDPSGRLLNVLSHD